MLNLDALGLVVTVTDSGISAPDYQTILRQLTGYFRQIYGANSKNGKMIAIYVHWQCTMPITPIIATYNSYSPITSICGASLSNNVAINGIARQASGYSNADVLLTGQVGTVIKNGRVRDKNGNLWRLPSTVTLDTHDSATVTAVCNQTGQITAAPADISEISTPIQGWQTVTNPAAAATGRLVETDNQLRSRQKKSVALP